MCLDDSEKRVSDAERFGDLNGPEDYATVLRHALEEHTDSDEVSEVMADVTLPTPCDDCGRVFASEVTISDALRVRSYCDACAESDVVRALIYRRVSVDEIFPEITETRMPTVKVSDADLEELDALSLHEYPYRVDVNVRILADPDPDIQPAEWGENVKTYIEDSLSDVPCVVEAEIFERLAFADTEGNHD
jgi:hypothetical protein